MAGDPRADPDLLALMGDSIDNIPGVPGVGEKTAVEAHRPVRQRRAACTRTCTLVPGKLREVLATHRAQALLSRELATVSTRVPLAGDLESLRAPGAGLGQRLRALWTELEFEQPCCASFRPAPAAAVAAEAAPVARARGARAPILGKVPAGDAIAVEWVGEGGPPSIRRRRRSASSIRRRAPPRSARRPPERRPS